MTRPQLLYIFPELSSFVKKDIEMLSSDFDIVKKQFDLSSKFLLPFKMMGWSILFPFWMFKKKAVVIQFGGYHTVVPALWSKLLGKKLIIVMGGFDAVAFPEINYGAFANKWMRKAVVFSYKNASLLLPVDQSLEFCEYSFYNASFSQQGVRAFIKDLKTPIQTIYNGYNPKFWKPTKTLRNSSISLVTVAAGVASQRRLELKGVQQIIDIAPQFPSYQFIIIGDQNNLLKNKLSEIKNIEVLPNLNAEELRDVFSQSHYYLQLSLSEGFPNALCEAMLCGCVPIVSNVASMPKIVGENGFILYKKDQAELHRILAQLPNDHSGQERENIRTQIAKNFSEESRKNALVEAIRKAISE